MDEAVLEKVWGPLFDKDGRPTARLSQLLRGLAMYIVGFSMRLVASCG